MAYFPTDPATVAELIQLRADLKLSNKGLAARLGIEGVTETFLSKYINGKLDRQVPNFEARFRDTLKSIRDRIAFGAVIFETSVTRRMGNGFDLVRRTGDIGLFTSPAGNGKTSAIHNYTWANPSAVQITLNASTRDADGVLGLIMAQIDRSTWKGNSSRYKHCISRFKGFSRMLIVDNTHRLDGSGRQMLFDFHDEAECPIGLVGNDDILERIKENDQQFSRIGIHGVYELEKDEIQAAAKRVAHQYSDLATAEAIEDLTAAIGLQEGRLRAVKKTVILAEELRKVSKDLRDDPRKAIRSAHARLVRNYTLPSD